jgi:hypothetical protein
LSGRVRIPGGGRKKKEVSTPDLLNSLKKLFKNHTAGCPVAGVKWTHLSTRELTNELIKQGYTVCEHVVKRLLVEQKLGHRGLSKSQTMKDDIPNRDEQFVKISKLRDYYLSRGYTVLSMDVKKKEETGRFHRPGKVWSASPVRCYDHDFNSFSSGRVTPHGIYDLGRNEGFITLGQGSDTAQFNVACLRQYWKEQGSCKHKKGTPILVLLDGGGSNGSRNRLFKQEMQDWADDYGLNVRVAHYPPYCSKYNPIEHRLFPAITRAWNGVMLDSPQTMSELITQRLSNLKSGLHIGVGIMEQTFEKGVKVFDNFLDYCNIVHDPELPKWNYRILAMELSANR